jgi:GT2 family glycosyltransferase
MRGGRIGAVVVNHNTREHLRRCLAAILADEPAQTIVVDTESWDGSAALVRREFPAVELLETENRGYGAGANAGLERIRLPHALVLNADTRPGPGALSALAAHLDCHPQAAVAGPLVLDEHGRPQVTARPFPTPLEILLQESGLHRLLLGKLRDRRPRPVDWVLGAALALRCDAVSEIGGFDETYFMYNEEVDLCLRLRQAGWEVHYAPVATVAHVGRASTSQERAAMAEQYVRSTAALYRRHFSRSEQAQLRAILVTVLAARSARDRLRLLLTMDRTRRRALQAELEAWRSARAALRGA